MAHGLPHAAESESEKTLIQYCRSRQAENNPTTIENAIVFMYEIGTQVGRFRMDRFVKRDSEMLAMQTAKLFEKARRTQAGCVTLADERDDGQQLLFTAISAFGDSIPPMFLTKDKTFEEKALMD
jgi:hypothetical protein